MAAAMPNYNSWFRLIQATFPLSLKKICPVIFEKNFKITKKKSKVQNFLFEIADKIQVSIAQKVSLCNFETIDEAVLEKMCFKIFKKIVFKKIKMLYIRKLL